MAKMSKASAVKLISCHPDIIKVIDALDIEITVIEGHRTIERQKQLIKEGKSKLKKADSGKHTMMPSEAIDIAPIINGTIYWTNTKAFYDLSKKVMAKAEELGIKLRFGGDWDSDGDYTDQTFNDLVHYELA